MSFNKKQTKRYNTVSTSSKVQITSLNIPNLCLKYYYHFPHDLNLFALLKVPFNMSTAQDCLDCIFSKIVSFRSFPTVTQLTDCKMQSKL